MANMPPRKKTTGPVSNRKPSPTAAATGGRAYADHVPAHTFAASTMPRMKSKSGAAMQCAAPEPDADDMPGTKKAKKMAAPQKFPKGGIIKSSRRGLFTAKAKSAGMGVQQYAAHVLAAKKGSFDASTVRQANFARNFGGAAKSK